MTAHHALHHLCLVSESTLFLFFIIMLMSAWCSLRSRSPLKTVFGKIGGTYQDYYHTYKTHAIQTYIPAMEAQDNPQMETLLFMKPQILKLSMHKNFIM